MSGLEVETIEQLIPLLNLRTVKVFEVSSRRRDGFDLGDPPKEADGTELHLSVNITDEELLFRCRSEFHTKDAVLAADAGAIFRLSEPITVMSDDVMNELAKNAGLPIVLPYLRSELQQAARRIGVAAPLLQHYWARNFDELFTPSSRINRDDTADGAR